MHTRDDLTARFCRSCQLADGEGCLGWAESHAGVPDGEGHRAGGWEGHRIELTAL